MRERVVSSINLLGHDQPLDLVHDFRVSVIALKVLWCAFLKATVHGLKVQSRQDLCSTKRYTVELLKDCRERPFGAILMERGNYTDAGGQVVTWSFVLKLNVHSVISSKLLNASYNYCVLI